MLLLLMTPTHAHRRFEKYGGLSSSLRSILDAPPEPDMDEYMQRSRVQVRAEESRTVGVGV